MKNHIKIVHIITTLTLGGAETMLYKLIANAPKDSNIQHIVVGLTEIGIYGKKLKEMGIPVYCLEMKKKLSDIIAVVRLCRLLRKIRPHILQTWLYHSDLIGLIAGRLARVPVIVWNVRSADMNFMHYARTTLWTFRCLAHLSRLPDAVIINSEAGKKTHIQKRYTPKRWEVIPNGFDTTIFKPDLKARLKLKYTLGLNESTPVIGMVARYDPMKDHAHFLEAAGMINISSPYIHFVFVGKDMDENNLNIKEMIKRNGLEGKVCLLGQRTDMQNIYLAFDIFTLSSFGEGFPNVIGEAMACGVPCVTTDVGDAAFIVGDTGIFVPPKNADALAQAWLDMLSLSPEQRFELGRRARKRIVENFSISLTVQRYQKFYLELLQKTMLPTGNKNIPENIKIESVPCILGCNTEIDVLFTGTDRINKLPGNYQVVKCTKCGLMWTNPRPTPESILYYYPDCYGPYKATQVNVNRRQNKYLLLLKQLTKKIFQFNTTILPPLTPGRMLEIGCASGSFLYKMHSNGWKVEGIEPSENAANAAQSLGFSVFQGPVENAPDYENLFDLVVGWMVFEHLHDPLKALKKIHRWVRPGGFLVLSLPNADSAEFRIFKSRWYALQLPNHLYHYTPYTLEKILNTAGWKMIRIFHQRTLNNLIPSIGYFLKDNHIMTRLSKKLVAFPEHAVITHLIFYPLAYILSLLGQTGRMTVWAVKTDC